MGASGPVGYRQEGEAANPTEVDTPMIVQSNLVLAAVALALAVWAGPAAAQKTDFPMRLGATAKCDKAYPIKLESATGSVESCVLRETARFAWSDHMLPTWCQAGKPVTFYQGWVRSCTMAKDWEFLEEGGTVKKPCAAGKVATINEDLKHLASCK